MQSTRSLVIGSTLLLSLTGLAAACGQADSPAAPNMRADELHRRGETTDTAGALDPSQCEVILKRAADFVVAEATQPFPKPLVLDARDIDCLAFEVQLKERQNSLGQNVANPFGVLLPQLLYTAKLGAGATGSSSSSSSSGGTTSSSSSSGGTDPLPDVAPLPCVAAKAPLSGLDIVADPRIASARFDREQCVGFAENLSAYLTTRSTFKNFLVTKNIRIRILPSMSEGNRFVYNDRTRVLNMPYDAPTNDIQSVIYGVDITRLSGAYETAHPYAVSVDTSTPVDLPDASTLVARFGDSAKLRITVEYASLEGSASSCYDYVQFQDEAGVELAKLCNGAANVDVRLVPKMKIRFFSDSSNVANGVKLRYEPVVL